MVGNIKPLYLASSIEDLQKQGRLGDVSKHKVKSLCESGEKVLKEANYTKEMGDEEKSYVLFFKYVELTKKVRLHPEYKKDEKYFDSMYNIKKNCKKAIDALECLTDNLDKRYNEWLKMETVREISEEVTTMRKSSKSSKIKVDFNSNENITSTPISAVANGIKPMEEPKAPQDYIVTHKRLHSIIQQKSTSFFILDTRSVEDYTLSHIHLPQSLNVSEQFLKPGTTAATIGKSLKIQERCQWERRTQQDMLIICDWTSEEFLPGTPVTVLRDALTKWDVGASHKSPPFLLEGGFEKFLFGYPNYVTNPKARAPLQNKTVTKIANKLDVVEYPDLDSGFLVTPSPSPKLDSAVKSGALTISKEPSRTVPLPLSLGASSQPRYPSLSSADLNSLTPKSGSRTTPSATNLRTQFSQPSIPDRSTKPVISDQSRDEFNDARNNFSLARTESGSSVSSSLSETAGNSNSALNNAMLESFKDMRLSNGLPKIDRESKKSAVMRIYGIDETKLDNIESVQEEELKVADRSLEREKEKLDLENKWEFLRREKEKQHEEAMRAEIMEEQEKLVKELDRLEEEKKEREESEKKLLEELERMKKLLKEKDDKVRSYQKNEEERRRKDVELREKREKKKQMLESVETKRKERKRMERESRESRPSQHQMNGHHEPSPDAGRGVAGSKRYLRIDDGGGGGGGLKRSFSSPNIAKMLEQEDGGPGLSGAGTGYSGVVPVPKFSRNNKPSLISARNFAGVWGTQKPGLTGLKNLGNTCYMNSILQCVSNTPPLAHYFVSRSFEEDVNEKYSKTRGHIASEFAEFKSISASDFKSRVGRYKSEFAGRDQQDSHEFLLSLLEWLHDDVNKVARPSGMPEQNSKDKQDVSAARRHWINYLERNQSIIVQLFCGQTRSVVRCFLCQGESVTYREFTNLTLPLPEHSNRTSLKECMDLYLREERIEEFKCDICKQTGKVTKKTDIVKFPPLLIIHLSRFYQDGMYTRKKQNFVNFELKNVNLNHVAVPGFDNKHTRFNLYAVSNHFGSLEGGHYTAYCSSDVLKKWYKFDDQDVSVMDVGDVVTPAAYILFYTAIEGQNSLPPLG